MNASEKIKAAFSFDGTPEIPAVICYENIFVRDHWSELTDKPWWHRESPDIDRQLAWTGDVITATGLDLFRLPLFYSHEDRNHIAIEPRSDGVYRVDRRTGSAELLEEPRVSGWTASGQTESPHPIHPADKRP